MKKLERVIFLIFLTQSVILLATAEKPDLVIEDIYIKPETPNENQEVTFIAYIWNIGSVDISYGQIFEYIVYIDDGKVNKISYKDGLQAGQYMLLYVYAHNLAPGKHTITFEADAKKEIQELNENNNVFSKTFYVYPAGVTTTQTTTIKTTTTMKSITVTSTLLTTPYYTTTSYYTSTTFGGCTSDSCCAKYNICELCKANNCIWCWNGGMDQYARYWCTYNAGMDCTSIRCDYMLTTTTMQPYPTTTIPSELCYDSDDGIDIYKYGYASDKDGNYYWDTCESGSYLKEYSCCGNYPCSTKHYCDKGCVAGKCVSYGTTTTMQTMCYDECSLGQVKCIDSTSYCWCTRSADSDPCLEWSYDPKTGLGSRVICAPNEICKNGQCMSGGTTTTVYTLSCSDMCVALGYSDGICRRPNPIQFLTSTPSTTSRSCSDLISSYSYIIKRYDRNNNGKIEDDEMQIAMNDWKAYKMTDEEILAITDFWVKGCSLSVTTTTYRYTTTTYYSTTTTLTGCSETDSGNDPYNYGCTTDNFGTNCDECSGSWVKEYYCSGNYKTWTFYTNCPNGCIGGRCSGAGTTTTTTPTQKYYCLTGEKDIGQDGCYSGYRCCCVGKSSVTTTTPTMVTTQPTTTQPITTLTFTPTTTLPGTTTTIPYDCLQKKDCKTCTQSGCSWCNWLVNFCLDCILCNFFGGTCISNPQNCPGTTTTTTTIQNHCVTIINNGNPSDKLDIVFVGDDYTNAELGLFISRVHEHINALLSTEPYATYRNRINVHYVKKFEDLGCHIAYERSILCNSSNIINLASECPNDNIVVLFKSTEWAGAGGESMSTSPYCVCSDAYPWLTIHECGGHHIGLLMDEYDYGYNGSLYYSGANCDTTPPCPKWAGTPGVGCYTICSYRNLYRPTENDCLMRTGTILHFCPVCKRQIISILNNYN